MFRHPAQQNEYHQVNINKLTDLICYLVCLGLFDLVRELKEEGWKRKVRYQKGFVVDWERLFQLLFPFFDEMKLKR